MSVYCLYIICSHCNKSISEPVDVEKILYCPNCKSELLTIRKYTGYIYILSNESMPGFLRIGCTERSLSERVKELSVTSGVPTPFHLEASYFSENYLLDEEEIHKTLSGFRVKSKKDFFKISLEKAIQLISDNINIIPCSL